MDRPVDRRGYNTANEPGPFPWMCKTLNLSHVNKLTASFFCISGGDDIHVLKDFTEAYAHLWEVKILELLDGRTIFSSRSDANLPYLGVDVEEECLSDDAADE